jgi:hypothetical protein
MKLFPLLSARPSPLLFAAVCGFAFALPSVAFAQKKPRVVTISEVTIVGRVQKPIAAVDVSRIQPKLTLAELRQPFLDRIEKAVYNDPF